MTNGVVLFAFNNQNIDYVKQAIYCAKRVKTHLNLPVQLITSGLDYIKSTYPYYEKYIDELTYAPAPLPSQKTFHDGIYHKRKLDWKNSARNSAYELSIFDKTLVLDTDFLVFNDKLLECFSTDEDFMIAKNYRLINSNKPQVFNRVSEKSIPMYWATILYFTKSKTAKTVFDLVGHIKENYNYYRLVYDIAETKFRNDYAFSIAVHMMRGFVENSIWPLDMPGDMWVSTDRDVLIDIKEHNVQMLAQRNYDYLAVKLKDVNIHVMNKFSLNKFINAELENE